MNTFELKIQFFQDFLRKCISCKIMIILQDYHIIILQDKHFAILQNVYLARFLQEKCIFFKDKTEESCKIGILFELG